MLRPEILLKLLMVMLLGLSLTACGTDPQPVKERGSESAQTEDKQRANEDKDAGEEIAAQVPDTEIFLADLQWQQAMPVISKVRNITNRIGYDNQPMFLADGESLLFTSIRDGKQSDIYRYLIKEKQTVAFALTTESEYSPTPMPGGNGVSVVRVEADGTQRLWRFPAANAEPEVMFEDVAGVGYHAWMTTEQAALFIVAEPALLLLADLQSGLRRKIAGNIGRALARIPGDNGLAFVDKGEEGAWRVARYDLGDGSLSELIDTPAASEDFGWSANGGLFMPEANRLLFWDGHAGSKWQAVAGFPDDFAGDITRVAVSPDLSRLAFVAEAQ